MALKVTHHDNRGDEQGPFGYVYFSDGTRLGYAQAPDTQPTGLFTTHKGVWEVADTPLHFKLAGEYLHEQNVKGY